MGGVVFCCRGWLLKVTDNQGIKYSLRAFKLVVNDL